MALIYVVDDAADYRFLIGRFLRHLLPEHTLAFFDDGASLSQAASTPTDEPAVRPDLVLMDIHMPRQDGIQTLLYLRQLPVWQPIPVIMMSSTIDPDEIDACYQAGASTVVSKTGDWPAFARQLQQVLAGETRSIRGA